MAKPVKETQKPVVRLVNRKTSDPNFKICEFSVDNGAPQSGASDEVDIVLVHGLTGDMLKTWGVEADGTGQVVGGWPVDLARDLRGCARVWSAGYSAPLFDIQLGTSAQTQTQEARAALAAMVRAGIGQRPIIFVAHSLGGLLVKAVLHCSLGEPDRGMRAVAERTTAVCFLGTPHSGSDLARWRFLIPQVAKLAARGVGLLVSMILGIGTCGIVGGLGAVRLFNSSLTVTAAGVVAGVLVPTTAIVLRYWLRPGRHVLRLDPENPELYELTDWYREVLQHHWLGTDAFYEAKSIWGLKIVPRSSADPGVTHCKPVAISANHIKMCKNPYVEMVTDAIKKRVQDARRGKDAAVFGKAVLELFDSTKYPAIESLTTESPDGSRSFLMKFKDANINDEARINAEKSLRGCLRTLISEEKLVPTAVELDLCRGSRFDVDSFVFMIWHEHAVADVLRDLRCKAALNQRTWPNEFDAARKISADPPPSLIPFYRSIRTIERICVGSLTDPAEQRIDRELLLETVDQADEDLTEWCPKMKWTLRDGKTEYAMDQDGKTRWLLLGVRCVLQSMTVVVNFVESCKRVHKDADRHGRELKAQRDKFEAALTKFENELAPSR